MLLIDTQAENTLADMLNTLKAEPNQWRCIYFNLIDKPAIDGIKDKIIASANAHIATPDTKVFLCEDTDICILAPTINTKDGKAFILDVAAYANMPANGDWVGFYEVTFQINQLMATVAQKLEKKRIAEMAQKQLAEQQQHERKRQAILNGGTKNASDEIASRRKYRAAPELMMIEDDAFSRRLVENVLQKKYALTGLAEADKALDTYSRLAPDLLFLDINLPDVTGHELLEKILKLDPNAYVIMLSGNADQANIMQAMSKGAKGFIAKPFTKDKLFQYIDRCPTIHTTNS